MADGAVYQHAIERDVAAILGFDADYFARPVKRSRSGVHTILSGVVPASILFVAVAITTWTPALTTGTQHGTDTIGGSTARDVSPAPAAAPGSGRAPWALGRERLAFRPQPAVVDRSALPEVGRASPEAIVAAAEPARPARPAAATHTGRRAAAEPRPPRASPSESRPVPPAVSDPPPAATAAKRERLESIDALRDLRLK